MDSERWSTRLRIGSRNGFRIDSPADGETVTDPLVVSGCAPLSLLGRLSVGPLLRKSAGPRAGSARERPIEILVDGASVGRLDDAVVERGRFALQVALPELVEGEHVLSLRGLRNGAEWGQRTICLRRPTAVNGARPVGRSALVRMLLPTPARPPRPPRVLIDCRDWDWVSWLVERNGQGWYGAALLDLRALPVGHHHLVVEADGHPPVALDVERLSEFG